MAKETSGEVGAASYSSCQMPQWPQVTCGLMGVCESGLRRAVMQPSWDTDPNTCFTCQCQVLDMLYLMSSDNYVTVSKGVIRMQVDVPSC